MPTKLGRRGDPIWQAWRHISIDRMRLLDSRADKVGQARRHNTAGVATKRQSWIDVVRLVAAFSRICDLYVKAYPWKLGASERSFASHTRTMYPMKRSTT